MKISAGIVFAIFLMASCRTYEVPDEAADAAVYEAPEVDSEYVSIRSVLRRNQSESLRDDSTPDQSMSIRRSLPGGSESSTTQADPKPSKSKRKVSKRSSSPASNGGASKKSKRSAPVASSTGGSSRRTTDSVGGEEVVSRSMTPENRPSLRRVFGSRDGSRAADALGEVASAAGSAVASASKKLPRPIAGASARSGNGKFQLQAGSSGSDTSLMLRGKDGQMLGSLPVRGDRPIGISPGSGKDSFLVMMASGRTIQMDAKRGQLRTTGELPRLPGGTPSAIVQAKDGTVYVASNRGGRGQIYTYKDGVWERNAGLGNAVTNIKSLTTDPETGELVMLASVPGTSRTAVIRSNASLTETATFLLPADAGNVTDIVAHNGQVYVAHGDPGKGKLSTFDQDGQLANSVDTGDMASLELEVKGGKAVIHQNGADGTSQPIDSEAAATPAEESAASEESTAPPAS